MPASPHRPRGMWSGRLLTGSLVMGLFVMSEQQVFSRSASSPNATQQGHAAAGRSIFNGKGACYYCHGVDGHRDKVPQLEADTAALIARLDPPPTDLRNPKSLTLKTDNARAKVIREGHEGTGMFPDTRLSDQDIADMLAYLASLRREGAPTHGGGQVPHRGGAKP